MENQTNPLKSYFRKPGIWIKLPSQGQFYKVKPTGLNDMGEIAIYPMTAKDELMLKNADALLNGSAIYELIKSCVPSITDHESMPSIDLDAVLVAIRRCTYGENMNFSTQHDCAADAKNESSINLDHVIATIKTIDNIAPITLSNGIKAFIRPVNVRQLLHLNWIQYEQIRNLQLADQGNVDEKTKMDIIQTGYEKLTSENIRIVSECIDTVLLPDGITVTDQNNIREWATDLGKNDFKLIENTIMTIGNTGIEKKFKILCSKCNQEYETQLDLNPTTFFE